MCARDVCIDDVVCVCVHGYLRLVWAGVWGWDVCMVMMVCVSTMWCVCVCAGAQGEDGVGRDAVDPACVPRPPGEEGGEALVHEEGGA